MIIDSHQHFWKYDPLEHIWITDTMAILKRNYLPEDLAKELNNTGVNGSIAVQASQSESETNFLLSLAKENKSIKAIVGWADLRAKNIEERLQHFTETSEKIKGFRHVVHDEPDANFILGKAFNNGISKLEKYDLTYDILIFPIHLEASIQFIKSHPNQKFVIDHIAKPYIETKEIKLWQNHMQALGKLDNVWCKVSGMVTETKWKNWKFEDFQPYLEVVFESFGTDRVMFGSDWPVCLLSASYTEVKGILDHYTASFSVQEKQDIMGRNALNFYGIDIPQN